MTNIIKIKRSSTKASKPTSLLYGEMATNVVDQTLYVGDNANRPVLIGSGAASLRAFGRFSIAGANVVGHGDKNLTVVRVSAGLFKCTVTTGGKANDTVLVNTSDNFLAAVVSGNPASTFNITTRNMNVLSNVVADPSELFIIVTASTN
jgi:hypothetical protein